jgi:hypothetical protein
VYDERVARHQCNYAHVESPQRVIEIWKARAQHNSPARLPPLCDTD